MNSTTTLSPGAARFTGGARSDKRATEATVDRLLFAMELSTHGPDARVPVGAFSPALLMAPDIAERAARLTGGADQIPYEMVDDAIPGWRSSVVVINAEDSPQLFAASHIPRRSAAMMAVARRAKRIGFRRPDHGYRFSVGMVSAGALESGEATLASVGGRLVNLPHRRGADQSLDVGDMVRARLPLLSGVALADRYQWSVSFSVGSSVAVRMWCSTQSARRLFDDRDKPESSGRRSALRDWVSEHWRVMPNDPDEETHVVQHLRGAQSFKWRGYDCCVRPSLFALERAGAIKSEKAEAGPRRRRARRHRMNAR